MANPYGNILFTDAVKAFQKTAGSEENYARAIAVDDRIQGGVEIGLQEAEFIAARDGFYQASVSSSGWPYVQFRGGPAGFVQVTGPKTLAWADLRRSQTLKPDLKGPGTC